MPIYEHTSFYLQYLDTDDFSCFETFLKRFLFQIYTGTVELRSFIYELDLTNLESTLIRVEFLRSELSPQILIAQSAYPDQNLTGNTLSLVSRPGSEKR